ncbi:cytochrome c oxidase accessory protein CcoG [Ideonella sp. DXS22W]|uniref:Cytochrome c oxidase accessory protein CcoG n=1 Tax=Pseudaquabacterium inlustre TaxID=2984192 RepID=A0ABU9CN55_9BURK
MSQVQRIIPITVPAVAPGIEPVVRIQPRAVSGRFTRWRWALVWATQLLFYGLPWLQWQGRQAVWFDLDGRRFHVFGAVLFPQDLILLTGLLIFSALLLFAATALFGRVWCGFACPQTVYTAMFMWIEQRAEGDRLARLRLDGAPWSPRKLVRRGGKHAAWLALSLVTGFSLVGWFTPVRDLALAAPRLAFGPWEAFWILFYGAATYLHAGLLREKVCQHACPYGRFQGAMLDRHSLIVGYDAGRGEPRGARARGDAARAQARARGVGDCVDCTLCVQVCPVGIDIRQGAQAACISCGLCIDACDQVMDKLGAPRGLVRFGAQAPGLAVTGPGGGRASLWRPRVAVYAGGLVLLAGALVWGWVQRPELRLNAMRDRSVIARPVADGAVENLYRLQVLNASMQPRRLQVLAVVDHQGTDGEALAVQPNGALRVEPAGTAIAVVSVRMTAAQLADRRPGHPVPIRFIVRDEADARADRPGVRAQTMATFLPG